MSILRRSFDHYKPPFGWHVDWGHPLAYKLHFAFPFNEGAGPVIFNNADANAYPPGTNTTPVGNDNRTSQGQVLSPGSSPVTLFWQPGQLGGPCINIVNNGPVGILQGFQISAATSPVQEHDTTGLPFSLQAWCTFNGGVPGGLFKGVNTLWNHYAGTSFGSTIVDHHLWIGADPVSGHLKRFSGFDSGFQLQKNTLYHIVYTFDASGGDTSGTEKFYVNGKQVAARTGSMPPTQNSNPAIYIGVDATNFFAWNGTIDWAAMWIGRALSTSDVEWLYQEPFAIYSKAFHGIPIPGTIVAEPIGPTDRIGRIVVLTPSTCCPCVPFNCSLCTILPTQLFATLTGAGPFCQCYGEIVIPLDLTPNICSGQFPGTFIAGWQGTASIPPGCDPCAVIEGVPVCDNQIQVTLCCFFFINAFFWQISIQSLPNSICDIGGFSTPGNSCAPFSETHVFAPDSGLQCCDEDSGGGNDSITITITT